MAILNIRGPMGSGKTTLVKRVMEHYSKKTPQFVEGRKRPLFYILEHEGRTPLRVIGNYEIACGGCDSIPEGPNRVYEIVEDGITAGQDILYEGIFVQNDVRRAMEMCARFPDTMRVIAIAIDDKDTIAGVQARRDARGTSKPLNPKNVIDSCNVVKRQRAKFRDSQANKNYHYIDREAAFTMVMEQLGWTKAEDGSWR